MDPLTALGGGQWILLLTTIGGVLLTLFKDYRNRVWAAADLTQTLARAAAQRQEDLAAIVATARAEAEALHIKLEGQLADTQLAAQRAYSEANAVNAKIATAQALAAAQILKRDAQMIELRQSVTQAAQDQVALAARDQLQREATAIRLAEVVRGQSDAVRARLDASAEKIADKVEASAANVRDRLEATVTLAKADADRVVQTARIEATAKIDTQTDRMLAAIEATARVTGASAEKAYHEANSVNDKIEKLHKHNELQAVAIAKLLEVVQAQHAALPPERPH